MGTKISALPILSSVTGSELVPIYDTTGTTNKSVTVNQLRFGSAYTPAINKDSTVVFVMTANGSVATNATGTLVGTGTGSVTIPANGFIVGRTIRVRAKGFVTTAALASTVIWQVTIGATVAAASNNNAASTITASMTNSPWWLECLLTCRTVGSSGTVFGEGMIAVNSNATPGLAQAQIAEEILCAGAPPATVTINTTTTQAIDLKMVQATNTAGTITCTNFTIEVLN